jgi:hypothetical protein
MKTKYLRAFIATLAFSLLFFGGLNQDIYGQGKGNGKGGGGGNRGGGPPGQQKKMENPNRGGGGQPQMRQMPQFRPQPQPQAQRQMRQEMPQQIFRQQQQVFRQPPGQARKQERAVQRQMPQPQVWRQQPQIMRQQQAYRQPPGQAKKQERVFQRQQQQAYVPSPVFQSPGRGKGNGNGNGNGRWKQEQRQMNLPAPWFDNGGNRVPPGQIRSAEVHQRNAIRKAEREQQRIYGQYNQPYYAPYVAAPVYQYNARQYGYNDPYYYSAPVYPSYQYYVQQYVNPYRYYDNGGYLAYSPLYVPNAYIYTPYTAYANYPYYGSYNSPYYGNYYGYDDGGFDWKSMLVRTLIGFVLGNNSDDYYGLEPYDPYYGYTQAAYYGDDSYAPYGGYYPSYQAVEYIQPVYDYNGYDVALVDTLPMYDMFGPSYGGYSSVTYREVLAQGYEQGYQAGWYAREAQLQNDWANSGFRWNDDYVDPYSYSIGENRRCFSEGYTLGYQDAVAGRQDYISNYSGGTDLVSLLLSNVIGSV